MANNNRKWREGQPFDLMDGSVRAWIDQGAIHLKAVEAPHGDPVELTEEMAIQLAAALREMAAELD
jgi:hypothetical protein